MGSALLRLTLKELFDWRFMQTDPNWGNFLYEASTDVIHLIDFGASREYPKAFVDEYLLMVRACAEKDGPAVEQHSTTLGFLTGGGLQTVCVRAPSLCVLALALQVRHRRSRK